MEPFKWLQRKVGEHPGMAIGAVVGGVIGTALGPLGTIAGGSLGAQIGNNLDQPAPEPRRRVLEEKE